MKHTGESQFAPAGPEPAKLTFTRGSIVAAGFAIAAGAALRLWMLHALFAVYGDSLIYGGIAKNLLLHGSYALTGRADAIYPTLIRLPGYPLFLAVCFRLFGMENYFAVGGVQIAVDLAGCLLLAGFARQMAESLHPSDSALARRTALVTLWLAALCPFTASYAAWSMAETLTVFSLVLAMFSMGRFCRRPGWSSALVFTFAVTYATLLRPDGALAAVAFAPAVVMELKRRSEGHGAVARQARMAVVCVLLALAPFAAWGWRNWHVFRVIQPLAPRLANDPDENVNPGWERWIRSWCLDFPCTAEIYWQVPDGTLDLSTLPDRAFDSPAQYEETAALAGDYNRRGEKLTSDIDARFGRLADERIEGHWLRYHLWLPLGRMADMWVRPRNENLPVDLHWWNYARHHGETIFAGGYILLNAAYLLLALAGLWRRPRFWKALTGYMVLRCLLLLSVQAPEARYTLECFPMMLALGGVALAAAMERISGPSSATPSPRPA